MVEGKLHICSGMMLSLLFMLADVMLDVADGIRLGHMLLSQYIMFRRCNTIVADFMATQLCGQVSQMECHCGRCCGYNFWKRVL